MSIRHDLVLKALSGDHTITELAKEYGVSRKTAHKWVARFQGRGLSGLLDDSRRPHSSPTQTIVDVVFEASELRKKHEEDPPINETTPVTNSERDFLY